jgi:hypothetical protein
MKYKIKFEIDLSGMDKQEVRDYKIELIQSGIESIETEIDPNIQLPIPKVGDNVVLSNKDFRIMDIKYLINSEEYVIILLVKLKDVIIREEDKTIQRNINAMRSLLK